MDGKNVILKDIHNLKAKFREENRGSLKDAQLLSYKLNEAAVESDPKACGGLVIDENDTIGILCYQLGDMREIFEKFPKFCLLIVHTMLIS